MWVTQNAVRGQGVTESLLDLLSGPAEELVATVNGLDDGELNDLLSVPDTRATVLAAVVERLPEFAVPDKLRAMSGTVRLQLRTRDQPDLNHVLSFESGTYAVRLDAGEEPVDVVLKTSASRFLRIASGEVNAGLAYLGGNLRIEGDALLALAVGGMFQVPGKPGVAVDPAALDPVDVATVVDGVSTSHLKKVMASGFRPVVLSEIFRRLPDFVNVAKAGSTAVTVGFRLTGDPSGELERYEVAVADGRATVREGSEGGSERDATVTCEGYEFLKLATGHMNPVSGVLRRQLKVKGDPAKALVFSSLLDIPKAR